MIKLHGNGVSPGIAKGRIRFLERKGLSVEKRLVDDAEREIERFDKARRVAAEQLDVLSTEMVDKIGKENALLFEVHRMLLEDSDYTDPIIAIIKTENACA